MYQNASEGFPTLVLGGREEDGRDGPYNTYKGTTAVNWTNYFADAPPTVQVGNIWHLGKEFVPPTGRRDYGQDRINVVGEPMPAGFDTGVIPAGGFAVKGVSLYVDRAGRLVGPGAVQVHPRLTPS